MSELIYLLAAVLFILSIRGLSAPRSARLGNFLGIAGMTLAIVAALALIPPERLLPVVLALAAGGVIGVVSGQKVRMTALPQMIAAFNGLGGLAAVFLAAGEAAADGTLLIMEGWAERETSDRVDALLDEYPNVLYIKSDPTPEDETPVKLKNNRFARIFEMVGDMYARPKYGTIDLTPFFAPFYMLFFGICLNDAGYGLILLAMGMAMLWKFKGGMMRRAAWFATMCAVSTIVFGLFCGSFFGVSLKAYFPSIPFFDFQGRFFSWALAIGLVQILFGQVLRIVMVSVTAGFRYALSTLGWFLVILAGSLAAGLPLLDPAWVIPGFTTSSPAFYGVAAIGVVLMLFFNSPGKNPFVNFGTGLWDTYNNITGILSDVLSYIRLFAIGLSGGILATVFNDLATGLSPDIPVVRELMILLILLVGHGINLFMSSISSFVHPMRLTFVEFYKNAGFEMAARQFEPLTKIDQSENK